MTVPYDSEGEGRNQNQVDGLQTESNRNQAEVQELRLAAEFARSQVDELRESVVVLASRVHGLSSSLDVVNEVQRAQQSIDRRTIEAMEEARKATATANRAENSVVPREELDARNAAEERLRHWDRKILLRKVYGAVLAALVICGALGAIALAQHNYQRDTRTSLERLNGLVFQACLTRNHNIDQTRQLYQSLIEAERKVADPRDRPRTEARIAAYQQVIDTAGTPLDCRQYTELIYRR